MAQGTFLVSGWRPDWAFCKRPVVLHKLPPLCVNRLNGMCSLKWKQSKHKAQYLSSSSRWTTDTCSTQGTVIGTKKIPMMGWQAPLSESEHTNGQSGEDNKEPDTCQALCVRETNKRDATEARRWGRRNHSQALEQEPARAEAQLTLHSRKQGNWTWNS